MSDHKSPTQRLKDHLNKVSTNDSDHVFNDCLTIERLLDNGASPYIISKKEWKNLREKARKHDREEDEYDYTTRSCIAGRKACGRAFALSNFIKKQCENNTTLAKEWRKDGYESCTKKPTL